MQPTLEHAAKVFSEQMKKDLLKHLSKLNTEEFFSKESDDNGNGKFHVIATSDRVDRDGEILSIEGWNFDNFMKNPVILWAHDIWGTPVAKATRVWRENNQVHVEGVFASTQKAQEIRTLYDEEILNTVSVGFLPMERNGNVITKAELLEVSFVPVPSNADALAVRAMKWLGEILTTKEAVAPHEPEKADEDVEWDADAAIGRLRAWASSDGSGEPEKVDWEKYAEGFAWYDAQNSEVFGSYKLPHHDVIDGEFKVVWRGVSAAMAALMGVRGGTDLPESDFDAVYEHISKHYAQFEKEPPAKQKRDEDQEPPKDNQVLSPKHLAMIQKTAEVLRAAAHHLDELSKINDSQTPAEQGTSQQNETTDEQKLSALGDIKQLLMATRVADKALEAVICKLKDRLSAVKNK